MHVASSWTGCGSILRHFCLANHLQNRVGADLASSSSPCTSWHKFYLTRQQVDIHKLAWYGIVMCIYLQIEIEYAKCREVLCWYSFSDNCEQLNHSWHTDLKISKYHNQACASKNIKSFEIQIQIHKTLISVLGRSESAQEILPQGPWHRDSKKNTVKHGSQFTCSNQIPSISHKVGGLRYEGCKHFCMGVVGVVAFNLSFPLDLHLEELIPPLSK